MNPPVTPEEGLARVKACLAEAGYPKVEVWLQPDEDMGGKPYPVCRWGEIPDAIRRQAAKVSGLPVPCWACWTDCYAVSMECLRGRCSHPEGPAEPPVELLRRPERSAL